MPSEELEKVLELMKSRPVQPNLTIQEQREAFEAMPGFPVPDDVR